MICFSGVKIGVLNKGFGRCLFPGCPSWCKAFSVQLGHCPLPNWILLAFGSCLRDICVYGIAILSQKLSKAFASHIQQITSAGQGFVFSPQNTEPENWVNRPHCPWLRVKEQHLVLLERQCTVSLALLELLMLHTGPSTCGARPASVLPVLHRACSASPSHPQAGFCPNSSVLPCPAARLQTKDSSEQRLTLQGGQGL